MKHRVLKWIQFFLLEFDKKKYYETLNEQKKLMQNETNNSND